MAPFPQSPIVHGSRKGSNKLPACSRSPSFLLAHSNDNLEDGEITEGEPMTEEELDRAKSVVLDLLGWGVTPEYLVDCGVSPGALVRIFNDLYLRLPTNLFRATSTPVVENDTP
ncbi:hypothetical protein V8B97DRAFT_2061632 [Scleroderma yunnanense]